jgi:bifunctional non-homologous end joining protein LigD
MAAAVFLVCGGWAEIRERFFGQLFLAKTFVDIGGWSDLVRSKILDPMPSVVEPMQPSLMRLPFSGPDWLFEPKWDGYRAICFVDNGSARFVSRNKRSLTEKFPELQTIVGEIRSKQAVFDGEIVALDEKGMPSFGGLQSRRRRGVVESQVVFYAFDLLFSDGRNLSNMPLLNRKRRLKKVLSKGALGRIRYTDHVLGEGEEFFEELERLGLEGMVAKKVGACM